MFSRKPFSSFRNRQDTGDHVSQSLDSKPERPDPESIPLGLSVLHEPHDEHNADIIFIHGLGGSSYTTWCKNQAPDLFWPKEWLPRDDEIRTARIFSYGYDCTLKSPKQSPTFGISEFARQLLFDLVFGERMNGQNVRLGEVPIIFVAHSMGGLVFKKAYLEALLDARYHHVSKLTKAVVFLSTPHRGSDLVVYLRQLHSISSPKNTKQYVGKRDENAFLLRELNEQFRHVAPNLQIFSFFEGLKTSRAGKVIVDGDSAKLGYPGEVCRSLNTDHQGMSKFNSPHDTNYLAVLGALKSLIISGEESSAGAGADGQVLDSIRQFFNMPDNIEDDIEHFESHRAEGTCSGILRQEPVKAWLEGGQSKVLWIHGRPARGKSVIASFLSRHLQSERILNQAFFFRAGDDSKRTISSFLSSMAFQSCQKIPQFRKAMGEIVKSGWKVSETEWRTLWKRIFENLLLKLNMKRPIYWVVDGIDECCSPLPLMELISAINQSKVPIRIVLISRWREDISSALERAKAKASYLSLCLDKDDEDIRIYVDEELRYTTWDDDIIARVKDEVLKNAKGNFLWVTLVLVEIKDCHTDRDIEERLLELPHGMNGLYQRMETPILALKRPLEKSLSQRLLSWVVQARKALTIAELTDILEPDFGRMLDLSRTLARLCGQFATIEEDKSVGLVHHTAREYLTQESSLASIFRDTRNHGDLFEQSLSVFSQQSINKIAGSSPSLLKYRATTWPYHLTSSNRSGRIDEQLDLLCNFFSSQSVLAWIKIVASLKQLKTLVDASQSLDALVKAKRMADAAKDQVSRRCDDVEKLEGWSRDLLKIIGKFGSSLLQDPGAVYHSLAPFCPTSSQVYKTFGEHSSTGIHVRSHTYKWDDCVARIPLGNGSVGTLMTCSDAHLAIVDASGTTTIWGTTAFELVAVLAHGENISAVCFSSKGDSLATYGGRTTKIWNTRSGSRVLTFPNLDSTHAVCMQFTGNDDTLTIVSEEHCVLCAAILSDPVGWDVGSVGNVRDGQEFEGTLDTAPTSLTISPDGQKIAAAYREHPVIISSTTSFKTLRRVSRSFKSLSGFKAMTCALDIRWHPDSAVLMGIFKDGFSFRFNMLDGYYEELPPAPNRHPVGIHCSPDGALYAIVNSNGSVEVYDYHSCTMIYQLNSPDRRSAFSFSRDGRSLYDLRGGHCTIWEPSALVPLSNAEDEPPHSHSFDDSAPQYYAASEIQNELSAPAARISYLSRRSVIALADAEGSVDILDTKTLQKRNVAQVSDRISADHLAWNQDGSLLCYSESGCRITVLAVLEDKVQQVEIILALKITHGKIGSRMTQLFFLGDSNILLAASQAGVFVFSLQPAALKASFLAEPDSPTRHWVVHPLAKELILAITAEEITVHSQEDLEELAQCQWKQQASTAIDDVGQDNISPALEEVSEVRATFYHSYILVKLSKKIPSRSTKPRFIVFDAAAIDARGGNADIVAIPEIVSSAIELPLNILANGNLVFLDSLFWITETGAILCPRNGGVSTVDGYVRTSW